MKRYAHYLSLLLLTLTAVACSPDDEDSSPMTPHGAQPMQIEVTAQPFAPGDDETKTRGYDWSDNFVFGNGDQIGIIGVMNGTITFNNYAYEYENSRWKPVNDTKFCYSVQGMTYIAYYPYSEKMNGKISQEEILDAYELPTDQSHVDSHLTNAFIYSKITLNTSSTTLSFNMVHGLCLLKFPAPQAVLVWDGNTIYNDFMDEEITPGKYTFYVDNVKYTANGSPYDKAKLLVKSGKRNITCHLETRNLGPYTWSTTQTVLENGKCYTIKRNCKIDDSWISKLGSSFYMRETDKFGFPCPTKRVPDGCIKIGTVARKGKLGGYRFINVSSNKFIEVQNNSDMANAIKIYGEKDNDRTPVNEEIYYRSDGSSKAAKDESWHGYVISEYSLEESFYTFDNAISNDDVINILGGRNEDIKKLSYQAFARSYNAANNAVLRAKFPIFKPLYDTNSELMKQTPRNTSKWFLPGILEYDALDDFRGDTQWLTDYPNNDAKHPYYYNYGIFTNYYYAYDNKYKLQSHYILAF